MRSQKVKQVFTRRFFFFLFTFGQNHASCFHMLMFFMLNEAHWLKLHHFLHRRESWPRLSHPTSVNNATKQVSDKYQCIPSRDNLMILKIQSKSSQFSHGLRDEEFIPEFWLQVKLCCIVLLSSRSYISDIPTFLNKPGPSPTQKHLFFFLWHSDTTNGPFINMNGVSL